MKGKGVPPKGGKTMAYKEGGAVAMPKGSAGGPSRGDGAAISGKTKGKLT